MYEYKVLTSSIHKCEAKFNELGKDGWRLVQSQMDLLGSVVAVFEREIRQ